MLGRHAHSHVDPAPLAQGMDNGKHFDCFRPGSENRHDLHRVRLRRGCCRADCGVPVAGNWGWRWRSEEHTSELQSLMRISYAVFCLKKKISKQNKHNKTIILQT